MKKTLLTLLVSFIALTAAAQEDNWPPDKIITIHRDTVKCEIMQYDAVNQRLYYRTVRRSSAENFVTYHQVALVYLGEDAKYYTLNSRSELNEYSGGKIFDFDNSMNNRFFIGVGYRRTYDIGHAIRFSAGYTRYLWKGLGVGIMAEYDPRVWNNGYMRIGRKYFASQYISTVMFTPYATLRLPVSPANDMFLNLSGGYGGGFLFRDTKSFGRVRDNIGEFFAGAGLEFITGKRTTGIAINLNFYSDGMALIFGLRFGN